MGRVSPLSKRTWDSAVTSDCGTLGVGEQSPLIASRTYLPHEVLGEIREVVWLRDHFALEYIFLILWVVAIAEEEFEEVV